MTAIGGERLQRELERALRALRGGDEMEALRIVRDVASEDADRAEEEAR